jgi:hypothetical protein
MKIELIFLLFCLGSVSLIPSCVTNDAFLRSENDSEKMKLLQEPNSLYKTFHSLDSHSKRFLIIDDLNGKIPGCNPQQIRKFFREMDLNSDYKVFYPEYAKTMGKLYSNLVYILEDLD